MAKKKGRRKRRRTRGPASRRHRDLLSDMEKEGVLEKWGDADPPDGGVVMSEVIVDFIEPYMKDTDPYEDIEVLVMLACLAWNASTIPDDILEVELEEMLGSLPHSESSREGIMRTMLELIERKREHFAHYTRGIASYDLTETEDGFHLSIISFLDVDEDTFRGRIKNEK